MATKQILHMNPGQGETSYARNSTIQNTLFSKTSIISKKELHLQKIAQDRMKPLIEDAIKAFCGAALPKSMVIADLGCSSGPNALTLVSTMVNAIHRYCMEHKQPQPEMCIFLNDLPCNDFNTVAKSLGEFKHGQDSSSHHIIVTSMVPGSFYDRLFTSTSVHFFCSSISLHWLSEAPEELVKSKIPMYDSDDKLRLLNREIVANAYARQFRKDFTLFLSLRAQELVLGGQLIFSLVGRCSSNHASKSTQVWKLLAIALNDMASRGMISKEKFDTFHIPIYAPLDKELDSIIEDEGSFRINKTMVYDAFLATDGMLPSPNIMASMTRAVFEPVIVQHFGFSGETMADFSSAVERLSSSSFLEAEFPLVCLCLSLTRAR
uniref:S-adenosyl-L-methionine n=2 Tax=Oryza sativa subsp. japonica TaxID=39947 RepID=Q5Z494_ORYSJ|nr:putative S-adenosyl-L-methionine [Oryza sativa Japonica Group]BAD62438.1 putative S-adenosyl-L-methionine [Oryza sativa Japonica Group]